MISSPMMPVVAGAMKIPALGLGTWQLQGDVLAASVSAAASAGYRHFDTAPRYENEAAVGAALRATGLARERYFVTTKVWHSELHADDLRRSAESSVERLGVGPVDLLLVHWPNPEVPLAETISALCQAKRDGLAHHVGVSNFSRARLEAAIALADEPLAANQCEYHPRLDQSKLIAACRHHGIAFIGYAPLGSGNLLNDVQICDIATAHDKTPAQVVLRWHYQQGTVAIPRSASPVRVAQNIDIVDFVLDDDQMAQISALAHPDGRIFRPSWAENWD